MSTKYLNENPDVAAAFARGEYGNMTAQQASDWHFANYGHSEGRDAPTAMAAYVTGHQDLIDYYNNNGGADEWGSLSNFGNVHWNNHGQYENRTSPFTDPALNRQYQSLQKQYEQMQTQYSGNISEMRGQLQQLQQHYEALLRKAAEKGDKGGGIVGGGVVPGDGSVIGGGTIDPGGGFGNSGAVYGPDGTMYSSAAAALAAGVSNFTSTPPNTQTGTPDGNGTTPAGNNMFMQGGYQTGNSNPGGFIGSANQQLFQYGRPNVGFPYGG